MHSRQVRQLAPLSPPGPDPISAAQRKRADRRRRANGSAAYKGAAVHQEQIGNIVCLLPRIHDRSPRISTHASSAHKVAFPGGKVVVVNFSGPPGAEGAARGSGTVGGPSQWVLR